MTIPHSPPDFTVRDLNRQPAKVLEACDRVGTIRIRTRSGRVYRLQPEVTEKEPKKKPAYPDFAARRKRRIRHRTHQAQPAAAIDNADAALGKPSTHSARGFNIDRISGCCRSAIHSEAFQAAKSSNINFAVALALPTTPGIPAPGCVPAPTKYRFDIASSRLCARM